MSEERTSENDTGNSDEDSAKFAADAAPSDVTPGTGAPGRGVARQKRGGIIAWLAMLLAILAIAAVGVDYLRDRSMQGDAAAKDAALRDLDSSIDAARSTLASLEQGVSALTELDEKRVSRIDKIERDLNERLRRIEPLAGRVAAVEASMSALQGISTGARDAWLLAEAEYYMQIANAQLQLANNPELARLALTHADERILQLGDPRLTGVRQALADELRALEVMRKPDIAGISLTLASIAGSVDALPLRQQAATREAAGRDIAPELSGMERAWASVKNAVAGIVSVRRTDEELEPLIAPEAEYFLRANLALQLQAARLALLRGEETIFRRSLDDVEAWLARYYDAESEAVQSTRATLAEIRASTVAVAMPDISLSLRLLRQLGTLSEATDQNDPASEGDADEPGQDQ